jgi:hypothetical protein
MANLWPALRAGFWVKLEANLFYNRFTKWYHAGCDSLAYPCAIRGTDTWVYSARKDSNHRGRGSPALILMRQTVGGFYFLSSKLASLTRPETDVRDSERCVNDN